MPRSHRVLFLCGFGLGCGFYLDLQEVLHQGLVAVLGGVVGDGDPLGGEVDFQVLWRFRGFALSVRHTT